MMHEARGTRVAVTLKDGTSLVGEVRRWWIWGAVRLVRCHVQERTGLVEADGTFILPRRCISYYQRGA